MASLLNCVRYLASKAVYSISLTQKSYVQGQITNAKLLDTMLRTFLLGKMPFLHQNKGEEMAPTIGTQGGTLLVRKIPKADPTKVYVGDMIMLKDPRNSDKYLVRSLSAVEGYEMVSSDEKDEPFILEKNECWVLADNKDLKPKFL